MRTENFLTEVVPSKKNPPVTKQDIPGLTHIPLKSFSKPSSQTHVGILSTSSHLPFMQDTNEHPISSSPNYYGAIIHFVFLVVGGGG